MINFHLEKSLKGAQGAMHLNVQGTVSDRECLVLFGSSGVGKTSILRMIAGLMIPEGGYLKVGDEEWYCHQKKIIIPPQERSIGFVFQNYALFPHMTVRQNLEYASSEPKSDRDFIDYLLDISGLSQLQKQKPNKLSGGQKQRLALIRAFVRKPKLLLLDEPLSALDTTIREDMQDYILKLRKEFATTMILVSHDVYEVCKLSDKVLVLEDGKIAKSGTPQEVFCTGKIQRELRVYGKVVDIQKNETRCFVCIAVGEQLVEVDISEEEIGQYSVGSKILLLSPMFEPKFLRISP